MEVLTLRMPGHLWHRLVEMRDDANKARAELNGRHPKLRLSPLSLSTVIRVLLEHGLEHRSNIDFEGKIVRPDRIHRERAEKHAALLAKSERTKLHKIVQELIEEHKITPPEFQRYIGASRTDSRQFYDSGQLPEINTVDFVDRLKTWIASMNASEETDVHASSDAPAQSRIDGSSSPRR